MILSDIYRNTSIYSQGQVEAHLKLEASVTGDAEVYVVVHGSTVTHVTVAERADDDLILRFTVPGMSLSRPPAAVHMSLSLAVIPHSLCFLSLRPHGCRSRHCHSLCLQRRLGSAMRG